MFDATSFLVFQVHGGGHGGVAAAVGDFLAFIENLVALPPPEMFAALLPGVVVMQNHHPMVVHFPIAFLLAFFILDAVASLMQKPRWREVAGWLLYLGTASAAVAVGFGLHAAATVPHGANVHAIMERHEHLGLTVLAAALILSVWRVLGMEFLQGAINFAYMTVAAIMVLCMCIGADLGGLMVYHYGVNVGMKPAPAVPTITAPTADSDHDHHEHQHSH